MNIANYLFNSSLPCQRFWLFFTLVEVFDTAISKKKKIYVKNATLGPQHIKFSLCVRLLVSKANSMCRSDIYSHIVTKDDHYHFVRRILSSLWYPENKGNMEEINIHEQTKSSGGYIIL